MLRLQVPISEALGAQLDFKFIVLPQLIRQENKCQSLLILDEELKSLCLMSLQNCHELEKMDLEECVQVRKTIRAIK